MDKDKDIEVGFSMRVKKPFRNLITMRAKSLNMTDSDYVKSAIINTKIDYKPMKKDVAKLALSVARIGNNINQIAYVLNVANKDNSLSDVDYEKILDELLDINLNVKDILHGNN